MYPRHLVLAPVLAAIALVSAFVAPSVRGQVTVSAPNPVTFVEGFEDQTIPTNGFSITPNWNSWTFTGFSGISDNGSGITGASQPAIEGHCTAFLQGTATISKQIQFSAGYARIRFWSALRRVGAAPDLQGIRVDVNGVRVFEEDIRRTNYDEYVTRPITIASTGPQLVTFTGSDPRQLGTETALLDNISVEQLWDWDNNIWSPHAPGAGDDVTIPAGVSVVAGAAATVRTLSIEGQLLAPMRAVSTLSARWITVMGAGAALEVGTEGCPFEQQFTITLRSPPASTDANEYLENADTFGTKAIMAMNGGRIDLHGAPRVSWVKLDGSVIANQTPPAFTVTPAVDWQSGDEVVIAPSFGFAQSDKIRVAAVIPTANGSQISIAASTPLQFAHSGGSPIPYATPHTQWLLDERAEVGLLTHNVKVEGDPDPNGYPRFGGHIMIMRCSNCINGPGIGRLSNVELYNMGQARLPSLGTTGLGRYPIHWHMVQESRRLEYQWDNSPVYTFQQYVRSCSIHKSHNRAVTVHGTNYLTIEKNVAYDHIGHGMFLEDGIEHHNAFLYNLVLHTLRPDETSPTDPTYPVVPTDDFSPYAVQNRAPASFWITNPENYFYGNVAAGNVGTGYWFVFHHEPTGPSHGLPNPHADTLPLWKFDFNVCHTCGSGFDVNDSVNYIDQDGQRSRPTLKVNHSWTPAAEQYIDHMTVYGCITGVYAGIGTDKVIFRENILADNQDDHMMIAAPHTFLKTVMVRSTSSGFSTNDGSRVSTLYDGPARWRQCHLVGYQPPQPHYPYFNGPILIQGAAERRVNALIEGISFDYGSPGNYFLNLRADNTHNPLGPGPGSRDWGVVFWDSDGSFCGTPGGRSIVLDRPFLRDAGDSLWANLADPVPVNPRELVYVSSHKFAWLSIEHPRIGITAATNRWDDLPDIQYSRFGGSITPPFDNVDKGDPRLQMAVIVDPGFWYRLIWSQWRTNNTRPVRVTLGDLALHNGGTTVLELDIGSNTSNTLPGLSVKENGNDIPRYDDPLQFLAATSVTCFHKDTYNHVWLRIVNIGPDKKIDIDWTGTP